MANRKSEAVPNELMDLAKRELQAEGAEVPTSFFEQSIMVKMSFKTNKPKDLSSFQAQFKRNIKEPGLYRLKNKTFSHSQPLQLAKTL